MRHTPSVSVGLPVYNEEQWLGRALDSWLVQDHGDFEIVLANNASTDGTAEICRAYSARDSRIRFTDNPLNIGPTRNHQLVFELSRGDFFVWAGGHDHVHPAFISKTLEVLQKNESVILCTTRSEFRDEQDVAWRVNKGGFDSRGLPPHERFTRIIQHMVSGGTANMFYGLYRRDFLSQVLEFKKTIGADVILLSRVALLGEVVQLDDILYYRYVPQNRDSKERLRRHVKLLVGEGGFEPNALMPYLGMLFGYISVIEESSCTPGERQFMYEAVLQEAQRVAAIVSQEVSEFIDLGREEIDSLKAFPHLQQYRALKILEGLERAQMLGFATRRVRDLMNLCRQILGKIQPNKPELAYSNLERKGQLYSLWNRIRSKLLAIRSK